MPSKGIIYSAIGDRFITEAIVSARSSLRFNAVAHLIYCNCKPTDQIEGLKFVPIEPSPEPFLDKLRNIARSPFAQTIYLDSDTYVTSRIEELFGLLNRFD